MLLLLVPTPLGGQDDASGFLWHPPRAESLRDFADAVDQARATSDDQAIREGLRRIAEEIRPTIE